ncbi:MAG: DUF4126 domain-containing protein [Chloroflexi bacterium]|jgi:hypothetical protein|nr:DUF4126 domain-containing protein [Chloroflexota bacterium]
MGAFLEIFSGFGLSASAGLNAYIPLLVTALLAKFTNLIHLQEPWDVLTSWWIIGLLIVLSLVEFFLDKVPVVNHFNDALQSIVRPTAGAVVFAASTNIITDIHPVLALALGLLVAGSVNLVKSVAVRPAVSASTGGAGNIPVSVVEDVTSTSVSVLSIVVPIAVACILIFVICWAIWRFAIRPLGKE